MPFGKFKGWPLEEIELQYLEWLQDHVPLRGHLRVAVSQEIAARTDLEIVSPSKDRVKEVYRVMAMKWHPDRGGTKEAMQAVNEFYEQLNE
jgi:uncharacterized protein (DUF3820 family)